MNDECPNISLHVNETCCGEIYRGSGNDRGLSNVWESDWHSRRNRGWDVRVGLRKDLDRDVEEAS